MPLRALLAAPVLAVAVCGQALAADVIGFGEAFDTLYSVNLTTRIATEIGPATPPQVTRYANLEGLTLSPSGQLFVVSDGHVKTLLKIDKKTGLATIVGGLNVGTTAQLDVGLAFTTDGRLWMSSGSGNLWQVNPDDASVTLVGNFGVKITGLTSRGNTLYGAGSQGNNRFYQIDTATAQAHLLGEYGAGINYVTTASPAFDATGKLWVLLDYVPQQSGPQPQWSDLATGNLDGALTNQGAVTGAEGRSTDDLEFIGLKGLAIIAPQGQSVPTTPAASWPMLAVLAGLFALVAGTRLRRRRPTR